MVRWLSCKLMDSANLVVKFVFYNENTMARLFCFLALLYFNLRNNNSAFLYSATAFSTGGG